MLKEKDDQRRETDDLEELEEKLTNQLHGLKLEKIRRKREKKLKWEKSLYEIYVNGCYFIASINLVIAIIIAGLTSYQIKEEEINKNKAHEINLDELDDSYFEYTSDWYDFGSNNKYTRFHYYKNSYEPFEEFSYMEIGEKSEAGIIVKHRISLNSIENRIEAKEKTHSHSILSSLGFGALFGNLVIVKHLLEKDKKEKLDEMRRKKVK